MTADAGVQTARERISVVGRRDSPRIQGFTFTESVQKELRPRASDYSTLDLLRALPGNLPEIRDTVVCWSGRSRVSMSTGFEFTPGS
jgi:hypothetical protein